MRSRWRDRLIEALGGVVRERTRSQTVEAVIERAEDLRIAWYEPGQDELERPEVWEPPAAALADKQRPQSHL
jgi:hypothetical protein